ncbi:MAG: CPBP family intramembrane metalloprotease [Actinomycetota bacterium]|nr:CPBP family intramembrane metalloprotease [Actinomycetota bacterium]
MNLFFNDQERRLRAFWRLLFQFIIYYGGAVVLGAIVSGAFALFGGVTLADGTIEALAASPVFVASAGVVSLVAALFSVWLAGRFFDRRPLSGFGLRIDGEWWLDFGFGLFLGALLMAGVFLVELAAGWIRVTGAFEATNADAPFFPAILAPLVWFVCVGFYEELVSRGYQLRNMAEGLNFPGVGPKHAVVLAWVLSSALFGLLHLANPNATAVSTVNIAFAGLLLAAGYVLTGRLATPIGLHMTWNFFQGNVFGFPVSGLKPVGATFLSVEQGGPALFTGGIFGPEAGLLGLGTMVVGILLIWLWVQARSGKATLQASLAEPPTAATDQANVPGAGG